MQANEEENELDELEQDPENRFEATTDFEQDVTDSSDNPEDLLEAIPEEELRAIADASLLPKLSSRKTKTSRLATGADTSAFIGDPVRMYFKEIGKVPLLTAEQEVDLGIKIERGAAAAEELERARNESIELDRSTRRHLFHEE